MMGRPNINIINNEKESKEHTMIPNNDSLEQFNYLPSNLFDDDNWELENKERIKSQQIFNLKGIINRHYQNSDDIPDVDTLYKKVLKNKFLSHKNNDNSNINIKYKKNIKKEQFVQKTLNFNKEVFIPQLIKQMIDYCKIKGYIFIEELDTKKKYNIDDNVTKFVYLSIKNLVSSELKWKHIEYRVSRELISGSKVKYLKNNINYVKVYVNLKPDCD